MDFGTDPAWARVRKAREQKTWEPEANLEEKIRLADFKQRRDSTSSPSSSRSASLTVPPGLTVPPAAAAAATAARPTRLMSLRDLQRQYS